MLKKSMITLLVVVFMFEQGLAQVNWQGQDWAFQCDFKGNDIGNVRVPASFCGPECLKHPECTHFSWTSYEGGACWMKRGSVSKNDAFLTEDPSMVCGVVNNKAPEPAPVIKELIWSSEFDSVNDFENDWHQETGGNGWGNNELQYYTNNRENIAIGSSQLVIEARKENKEGSRFTSARLISKKAFRYGFYEMKAKLPVGRGIWPAFWMLAANRPLNWPNDGEIDIMEYVGYERNRVHGTIHCQAYNHMIGTQKGTSTTFDDTEYNLFQLDWKKDSIRIYVNNRLYFSFKKESNAYNVWPFDNRFNIILNTAVGGNWGGAMGLDESIFPQRYYIDYVRVFDNGEKVEIV